MSRQPLEVHEVSDNGKPPALRPESAFGGDGKGLVYAQPRLRAPDDQPQSLCRKRGQSAHRYRLAERADP